MRKAYSILTVKSVDEGPEFFTIKGVASTPEVDRDGDIVRPEGAKFKLPMPLLWQHNHYEPIGNVTFAKPGKKGIPFEAKIPNVKEPGTLRNRIMDAVHSIKYNLVAGVSIGFRRLKYEIIESTGGFDIKEWDWYETSIVTIPANISGAITGIKSFDSALRAALGKSNTGENSKPGVSGKTYFGKTNSGDKNKMNIYEMLRKAKQERQVKLDRLAEIKDLKDEEKRAYTDDETGEIASLMEEIKEMNAEIMDLEIQAIQAGTAKAAVGSSQFQATYSRGPEINLQKFKDPDEKFKGQNYTRMVIAKALAHLNNVSPVAIAMNRWGKSNPLLVEVIKAAVEGGGAGSGEWGAELVTADNRYTGDFIEFLYSRTAFDQLPFRQVPANITIKGQDGQATGYWVGESKAITPSTGDFSGVSLTPLKVAALAVISNELLRDSSPASEQLVRDALVNASSQRVDTTVFGTAAAVAGVSPAGLLNGVSAQSASGVDADAVIEDIKTLYAIFLTAKNASDLSFVMNKQLAKALQLMRNTLGLKEFPDINQNGGALEGDAVVTGDNINAAHFILLKPSDIWRIGDMGVEVSISREATIEMNDSPAMDSQAGTAASGNLVSMFQTESTAIKIVRPINVQKRRSGAVQYVSDAAYGTSAS